jgi:hypothetical protein
MLANRYFPVMRKSQQLLLEMRIGTHSNYIPLLPDIMHGRRRMNHGLRIQHHVARQDNSLHPADKHDYFLNSRHTTALDAAAKSAS